MFDQAQLRKGTLEGSILQIISREPTYGYAIAATLRDSGFSAVTEGTLYPLLLRLERKGLIAAEYRAGSGGPSRKYYRLTPDGVQYSFRICGRLAGGQRHCEPHFARQGGLNRENHPQRVPRTEKGK